MNGEDHYQLGDAVQVRQREDLGWTLDWRGETLFVAGIYYEPTYKAESGIRYTLSEVWPPRHNGDLTSDFHHDQIEPA